MSRLLPIISLLLILLAAFILLVQWVVNTMAERYRISVKQLPSAKGMLMFILPLPLLMATISALARGELLLFIGNALGYTLLVCGALLLRHGLLAETEYQRRRMAKWPLPLKTVGSVCIALGIGIAAWIGARHPLLMGIAFGLLALLGCYLTYGFDPRTAKRILDNEGIDVTDQVLQALHQAEQSIAAIEQASRDIRNLELKTRLRRIAQLANEILKLLEEQPRDLRRARKFLHVYLDGAQKVTEGYAKTHARVGSTDLDDNFRRVLITIEEVFQEQQQKLLEADVSDLDIQIEVLTTQLKREGVI